MGNLNQKVPHLLFDEIPICKFPFGNLYYPNIPLQYSNF